MNQMIRMLAPTGECAAHDSKLAPTLKTVRGTVAGFRVQWPSFDIFMKKVEELLIEKHGVTKVNYMFTGSDGTAAGKVVIRGRSDAVSWAKAYDDFAARNNWGILGLAA